MWYDNDWKWEEWINYYKRCHQLEDMHGLHEAKPSHKEGSLPSSTHWLNVGHIGWKRILLLPWWVFWIQSNCYSS